MKNKLLKRLTCLLLTMIMILSAVPVHAEGGSSSGIFGFSGEQTEETADESSDEVSGEDESDAEDSEDKAEVSSDADEAENGTESESVVEESTEDDINLVEQTIHADIVKDEPAPIIQKIKGLFKANKKDNSSEVYANDDIILSGKLPNKSIVEATPVTVEIDGQTVLVAYDIKIYTNENQRAKGKTWQPADKKIKVTIKSEALNDADMLSIYHMQDAKSKAELVSETAAENGAVTFDAESFSIYVVAKGELTKTYTFMNGDAIYSKQVLKNGDALVEPSSPVKDDAVFSHWSLTEGGEKFTGYGTVTVDDGTDNSDVTLYAVYGEDRVIVTYYDQDGAVVQRHEVTKPSGSSTKTEDTTEVLYSPNQSSSDVFLKFRYWTEGQANLADPNPPQAGMDGKITIDASTQNIDLYPVVSEGHWIYFDNNKSTIGGDDVSVSYVEPLFVVNGSTEEITAEVPTTAGYTFDGWYTRRNGGTQIFDADGTKTYDYQDLLDHQGILANNPTLYAHWTAAESVEYTVVFWRQKITDDKDTADKDKKYDYAESIARTAAPRSTVSIENADKTKGDSGDYTGFHYNDTNSEKSVVVKGDGSSVINVYYDRNLVTFRFRGIPTTSTSTDEQQYAYVNNEYVPLTKNGNNYYYWTYNTYTESTDNSGTQYGWQEGTSPGYVQLQYHNNRWRSGLTYYSAGWYLANNSTTAWNGTRYKVSQTGVYYKGLDRYTYSSGSEYQLTTGANTPQYGMINGSPVPLTRNNYSGNRYKDEDYTGLYGQKLTDYYPDGWPASYIWRSTENGSGNVSLYPSVPEFKYNIVCYQHSAGGTSAIEYFLENLDGTYSDSPALTMKYAPNTSVGLGITNNVFVGFTASEYRTNSSGTWSDWQPVTSKSETLNQGLQVRFKRDEFKVSFADSATKTTYSNSDANFNPRSVKYEATLADAKPASEPTRAGYTFIGWYYDEDGKAAKVDFDNDTMPSNNLLLYAGWEKISFKVNIDPNGGEIGMPVNEHSTWFNLEYGESITEYADVQRNYVLGADDSDGLMHYEYKVFTRETGPDPNVDESLGANYKRTALYKESSDGEYIQEPGAYTLQGWFKVKSDGTVENKPYNFSEQIKGDITLRAMWRRTAYYSVAYDVDADAIRAPKDTKEYIEGANAVAEVSLGAPAGKRFIGWKDKAGNVYQPNSLIPINEDLAEEQDDGSMRITLTAQYANADRPDGYMADYTFMVPTITDDGEGNTTTTWNEHYKQTIATGETLVQPLRPTGPEGKVFVGWFTDQQGKHRFDGFGVVNDPVYTTLYAHFEDAHVITYYMANEAGTGRGDVIITTQTYIPGDKLNTLYVDCPTDDDHMVDHWTDGTNDYPYKAMTNTAVNDSLVLWPVLKEQRVLSFDLNGGHTTDGHKTMDSVNIPAQGWPVMPSEPVREGYVFDGWFPEKDAGDEEDEYKFNGPLPAGVELLYAHWSIDTVNQKKGSLTIQWYAQLPDSAPDGKTPADNYELAYSHTYNEVLPYGDYRLDDEEGAEKNATATLTAAVGGDIWSTDRLVNLYEGETKRYNQADLDIFFQLKPSQGISFQIDDSTSNTIRIYFDRRVYTLKFHTEKKWQDTDISSYGNSIKYKNVTYTGSDYEVKVWLEKDVFHEWPIWYANPEDAPEDQAQIVFNTNNITNVQPFNGWVVDRLTKDGSGNKQTFNQITAYYAVTSSFIKYYNAANTDTLEAYVNGGTGLNINATVQYFFDGVVNHDYDQEVLLSNANSVQSGNKVYSNFRLVSVNGNNSKEEYINFSENNSSLNSSTGRTYYTSYVSKNFDGYDVIGTDKPNTDLTCWYQTTTSGHSNRGRYEAAKSGTRSETYKIFRYYVADEWKDTTFYNGTETISNGHNTVTVGKDQLYFANHLNTKKQYAETPEGWTDVKNDYSVKVGSEEGTEKTPDTSLWYQRGNDWIEMSWKEFTSQVIVREEKTASRTVPATANTLNFYYSTKSYPLTLKGYDGVSTVGSFTVEYNKQLYGNEGILSNDEYKPGAPEGYEFDCWSTSPDASDTYTGDMPAHALVLYARYRPIRVTVTTQGYDWAGQSANDAGNYGKFTQDTRTALRDFGIVQPHKEGENFFGWYKDAALTRPISLNDEIMADTTIYPKFTSLELRGLMYNVNGGTGDAPSDEHRYVAGAEINVLNGADLTKTLKDIDKKPYTANFVCWNTKPDGTGLDYYNGDWLTIGAEDGELIDGVRTMTLYAQYNARRETTLVYNLNDSTDNPAEFVSKKADKTVATESDGTLRLVFKDYSQGGSNSDTIGTPNTPVIIGQDADKDDFYPRRPGFTFAGWSETQTDTEGRIQNEDKAYINTLNNGNNVLYAIWKEDYLPIKAVSYANGDWQHAADVASSEGAYWVSGWNKNNLPDGDRALITDQDNSGLYTLWQSVKGYRVEGYYYAFARLKSDPEVILSGISYELNATSGRYEWKYTGTKNGSAVAGVLDNGKTGTAYNDEVVLYYYKSTVDIPVYWFIEENGTLKQISSSDTKYWEAENLVDKTTVDAWISSTSLTGTNLVMPQYLSVKDSSPLIKYDNKIFGIGPKTVTSDKTKMSLSDSAYYVKNTRDGLIHSADQEFKDYITDSDIAIYVIYGQEELEIPAPTGVFLRFLPYVLICIAGLAMLVMMRRRRESGLTDRT